MTIFRLLDDLKNFVAEQTKDMKLLCSVQKGDTEQIRRAPDVYKMRLPQSDSAKKLVPYIIIQFVNGVDEEKEGEQAEGSVFIRMIFAVYNDDEQEGALDLLNVMDRVRIALLENIKVGDCFKLDAKKGLESIVYPDDTAPYFAGELVGTFEMPPIHRKVSYDF